MTQGSDFETGPREVLVIREIGTDASTETSPAKLEINDVPLGGITQTLSPLSKINSLFVDLLDLKNLFYVVPPETAIVVAEPAAANIRCKGELLKLAPGEALSTNLMARFKEQPNHYLTFEYGTVDWAAGKAFAVDEEVEVISLTPKTIEKYIFYGLVQAKCPDSARAVHEIALRFYLDNAPLDFILEKTKRGGIDLYNTPYPPAEATEHRGYMLLPPGITVLGDHTLSIRQRNIKAAVINIGAVAANGPYVAICCEFIKTG